MASEVLGVVDAGNSGTTIEIKVKTMDSQTYTLQVDKQMPVPALKECIASVTGVVTDHQRLICRGKVLTDDQLLSAYHVEDGHTLHLVVREPTASSSSQDLPVDSGNDRNSSGNPRGRMFQYAPGIMVETFSSADQGNPGLSDLSQIISTVLGSMGVTPDTGSMNARRDQAGDRQAGSDADTTRTSAAQSGMRMSIDGSRLQNALGIPAGVSFGSVETPVIPNAIATLSQYLNRLSQDLFSLGRNEEENNAAGASTIQAPESENTPEALAELLSNTRQMLDRISNQPISFLINQLQEQQHWTDPMARSIAQAGAMRTGILLQNLGAFFLELGRTVMTVRLGRSPSEAAVNAGPAVYISSSGPNPLMVQALPFRPGASFGTPLPENLQSGPGLGLSSGIGPLPGLTPRRIDIQIHRVSPSTPQTEAAGSQRSSPMVVGVTRQPTPMVVGVTRHVQPRTDASNPPSSNSGAGNPVSQSPEPGSLAFLYQLLGRTPPNGAPADSQTTESTNVEDSAGNGRAGVTSGGNGEPITSRTIEVDILSSGGIPGDLNADGQISSGVLRFLRGIFPGGEFHVENISSEGVTTETTQQAPAPPPSAPAPAAPSGGTVTVEEESVVTQDGLLLSALLREIWPIIAHDPEIARAMNPSMQTDDPGSSSHAEEGSQARTSRPRDDDNNPTSPDSKRQRME